MNIDGITILKTIPAYMNNVPDWIFIALLAICAVVFFMSFVLDENVFVIVFALSIIMFLVSLAVFSSKHQTRYKITVDDNVSYNAIIDTFDIVDTDGKILTVELKDDN